MSKEKPVVRYDKDGKRYDTEFCWEATPLERADEVKIEEGEPDLCGVCDTDLFFSSEITKRIAILGDDKSVTGWICPSCFTEFDNKDKILVLMSKSSVQGKT